MLQVFLKYCSHETISLRHKRVIPFFQIFSTGSITVTAPSVANVQAAVEHIYPKVIQPSLPLLINCMNSTWYRYSTCACKKIPSWYYKYRYPLKKHSKFGIKGWLKNGEGRNGHLCFPDICPILKILFCFWQEIIILNNGGMVEVRLTRIVSSLKWNMLKFG